MKKDLVVEANKWIKEDVNMSLDFVKQKEDSTLKDSDAESE